MHVPVNFKAVLTTAVLILTLIAGSVIADLQAETAALRGRLELHNEILIYLVEQELKNGGEEYSI